MARNKGKKKMGLTTMIFISLILGAVVGAIINTWFMDINVVKNVIVEGVFYVIGQGFISLMKMLVVPLVFFSIICGAAAIGDTKTLGSVGVRTIIFYLFTTMMAVAIALCMARLINPGIGLDMSAVENVSTTVSSSSTKTDMSIVDTILNIIPTNPVAALANGEMLQIIVFALLVGVILAKLKEKDRQDRIQAEKELQELLTTYDYFDLIRFVYDSYNSTIKFDDYTKTKAMQNKVKKALNPNNDLSFVWIENEYSVRTSKNIRMNMDIVKTGLKLWKHNKIKHGYKVDFYTVLEVRKDYIQIGCHKIPTENIQALYEKIYPSKSEPVKELQEVA